MSLKSPEMYTFIARVFGVDAQRLRDKAQIHQDLIEIAQKLELLYVKSIAHQFEPSAGNPGDGVTVVGIIGASDINIHTWPEKRFLRAAIESCSESTSSDRFAEELIRRYHPARVALSYSLDTPFGPEVVRVRGYIQLQPDNPNFYPGRYQITQFERQRSIPYADPEQAPAIIPTGILQKWAPTSLFFPE